MPVMRMMQVAIHQVVNVVAVRHSNMPTPRAMLVARLVSAAAVRWRTIGRIGGRDVNDVLLDRLAVLMMQMPVVQVVDVSVVQDGGVATTLAVYVGMIGMV
jgi:hypothetical protein